MAFPAAPALSFLSPFVGPNLTAPLSTFLPCALACFFANLLAARSESAALASFLSSFERSLSLSPRAGSPLGTLTGPVGRGLGVVFVVVGVGAFLGFVTLVGKVLEVWTRSGLFANLSFVDGSATISSADSRSYLCQPCTW